MSIKFMQTWSMTIQGRFKLHVIEYPLTISFNTNRKTVVSMNVCNFRIYNLKKSVRDDILRDPVADLAENRLVEFSVGYTSRGSRSRIFKGSVYRSFSYREGPDIITEIEGYDGLFAIREAQIEQTFSKGLGPRFVVLELIKTLESFGVTLGALGLKTTLANLDFSIRAPVFVGNTWKILTKLLGDDSAINIDKEKVYALDENEMILIPGNLDRIDSSTGLLDTPRRRSNWIDFNILLEPRLDVNQRLEVFSDVNPNVNGIFKVRSLMHKGVISGGVKSTATTSVGCREAVSEEIVKKE